MKNRQVLVFSVIGVLVFFLYIQSPILSISSDYVELGSVKSGSQIERTIKVRNFGIKTLYIKNLFKSCSCTEVSISTSKLYPFQSAEINFKIDVGSPKEIHEKIILQTNCPFQKNKEIDIFGISKANFEIDRKNLFFSLKENDIDKQRINVIFNENVLDVRCFESDRNPFRTTKINIAVRDRECILLVENLKKIPLGKYRTNIILEAKKVGGELIRIKIPVFFQVKGDFSVVPENVFFEYFDGKGGDIRLLLKGGVKASFAELWPSNIPGVRVELVRSNEVHLIVDPDKNQRVLDSSLFLFEDKNEIPRIVVPVVGYMGSQINILNDPRPVQKDKSTGQ